MATRTKTSAAEFGSGDARRVTGTADRRNASRASTPGRRATSHRWSSCGDCAGATEAGHARCRGSASSRCSAVWAVLNLGYDALEGIR